MSVRSCADAGRRSRRRVRDCGRDRGWSTGTCSIHSAAARAMASPARSWPRPGFVQQSGQADDGRNEVGEGGGGTECGGEGPGRGTGGKGVEGGGAEASGAWAGGSTGE